MKYAVEYMPKVEKQIRKLDKHTRKLILAWIEKNLIGCENPRLHGSALTADRAGQWRYRIGDYRIIAEILDDKIVVLIVEVGHRRIVYQ